MGIMDVSERLLTEPAFRFVEAVSTVPVWSGFFFGFGLGASAVAGDIQSGWLLGTIWVWMFAGVVPVTVVAFTSILRHRTDTSVSSPKKLDLSLVGCFLFGWILVIAAAIGGGGSLPRTGSISIVVWIGMGLGTLSVAVLATVILIRFVGTLYNFFFDSSARA